MNLDRKRALACLAVLLKPIVGFCLRHGIKFQDINQLLKTAFVSIAREELSRSNHRINTSRLSTMTGLQRKDLVRMDENSEPSDIPARDLIGKVLGMWQAGHGFTTSNGTPRVLSYTGAPISFVELVRKISKDLNPASVLAELERVNAVQRSNRGIRLLRGSFAPRGSMTEGFDLVGRDMQDLIAVVEENVILGRQVPNLHARTEYDAVRVSSLPSIRAWMMREGHRFHDAARTELAKHDQDINPDAEYRGSLARVLVSAFSLCEVHNDKDSA